ncbi:MAG TPA: class I SAM-dependent methyltransferase [Bryobacteraceae bacterium]|nr:class I SAM-dependent methyltransferase [Bryobacteraceae bacterium]
MKSGIYIQNTVTAVTNGQVRESLQYQKALMRGVASRMRRNEFLLATITALGTRGLFAQSTPSVVPQGTQTQETEKPKREPDVIYVPTPQKVVDGMLKLAEVHKGDVVYDLGCGDGRIPVTAAKTYGVRAVGIDINPERIKEAKDNVAQAGVGNLVTIKQDDLFTTDISEASVVTLYLLTTLNVKLRPKLLKDLKPGTRIVSHYFNMGDWKPDKQIEIDGRPVYMWTVSTEAAANLKDAK